tara:strand:+ start:132 stop:281 length:150 start_codon:yes stop_codon:yes gene_type:complete
LLAAAAVDLMMVVAAALGAIETALQANLLVGAEAQKAHLRYQNRHTLLQ